MTSSPGSCTRRTAERLKQLRDLIVNDINDLITGLVMDAKAKFHDVAYIVCAGNTTMVHLLLGLNPANIRREPYVPCAAMPPVIRAAEIGIKINPRGLLMACPAFRATWEATWSPTSWSPA